MNAHTQVKGRTRPILVDPVGLLLAVVVTAAHLQDRDGADSLLDILQHTCSRLWLMWADQADVGPSIPCGKALRRPRPRRVDIAKRSQGTKGVAVRPTRGIVERTRRWVHRARRLSTADALWPQTRAAIVRAVIIPPTMRRLARTRAL